MKPLACNNKPYRVGYWAPQRKYLSNGAFVPGQVWVPFAMSQECVWDRAAVTQGCQGCKKNKDAMK